MKYKKPKFKYKIIRPEQVDELRGKSNTELLAEFLSQSKKLSSLKKQKKEDRSLVELTKEIKEHRDSAEELVEAKSNLKKIRETTDSEIEDEILDKKSLEGGYRDEAKGYKELMDAIQQILEERNFQS